MAKAKPAKNVNKAIARKAIADALLSVEIHQNGARQAVKCFNASRLVPRSVTFGSGTDSDLVVPFSRLPKKVQLFRIRNGRVLVYLDQRFEGFLNDGKQFGEVREFTAPKGSIAELASVLDPLAVDVAQLGRGCLRFAEFEIIFKVTKRKAPLKPKKVAGGVHQPISFAQTNTPIERWAPVIAAFGTAMVAFPLVGWLLNAPKPPFGGLDALPLQYALEVVHPKHFQVLPWVYRSDFDENNPVPQAVEWIRELQKRWTAEEKGEAVESSLEVLNTPVRDLSNRELIEVWQKSIHESYVQFEKAKEGAQASRALKLQREYPKFMTVVSGGLQGSLVVRQRRRLARLEQTRMAIFSILETEHQFVKSYLKEHKVRLNGLFEDPKLETIFSARPEAEYHAERKRYEVAQSFANAAENSRLRVQLQSRDSLATPEKDSYDHAQVSVVWLSSSSALVPNIAQERVSWPQEPHANLIHNARYALGEIKPPPLPAPKPRIDMSEVEFVVFGRREEIKACYDAVLRRDPKVGGVVNFQWSINERGVAQGIRVLSGTIKENGFLRCIQSRIGVWKFPKPQHGSVVVSYPFRFVLSNEAPGATRR